MKQKTLKALCKINILLDNEQKKLSDRLKNQELSHNRKYRLLQDIEKKLKFFSKYCVTEPFVRLEMEELLRKINNELTYCGRIKGVF